MFEDQPSLPVELPSAAASEALRSLLAALGCSKTNAGLYHPCYRTHGRTNRCSRQKVENAVLQCKQDYRETPISKGIHWVLSIGSLQRLS